VTEEENIEHWRWNEILEGLPPEDRERVETVRRVSNELKGKGVPFWLVAELPNPGGTDLYRHINWRPEIYDSSGNLTPAGKEFSYTHLGGLANAALSVFREMATNQVPGEDPAANWSRTVNLLLHFSDEYNRNLVIP